MMIRIVMLCAVIFARDVTTMYSTKEMEGYPSGYLSDCPGSEKEAVISNKTLHTLLLKVQGPGTMFTARRRAYTFYQMKKLAKDSDMDFSRRTVIYVAGYVGSSNFPGATDVGAIYKGLGYNVLLLDTYAFSLIDYPQSSRVMRAVGKNVAVMLKELTSLGLDPKKLELVGLSLGAHTISFIAKNYKLLTGISIARLTGLDPAGPCFRNLGPENRIDESDADFVDIIKTNIDGYGMAAPTGHINFYVNGGENQPGGVIWYGCTTFCSHMRSLTMWLAALENPNSFIAMRCDSVQQARNKKCYDRVPQETNLLGLNTDPNKRGIFYLSTGNSYPFYLGKKGLKKENDFFLSRTKIANAARLLKV